MKGLIIALGVLTILVTYFVYFGFLDTLPMHIWDEARVANNSLEMLERRNWLVIYYDNGLELYNTKPPLLHWVQAAFMAALGPSDLSVRLPSAIAGAATGGLLVWFCWRRLHNILHGLLASLVLATSIGFMAVHAARSADYDALLSFFTTAYVLAFYTYCQNTSKRIEFLFFGSLLAAALTKSVAGFLFCPGLALYAIATGTAWKLMRRRSFYLGSIIVSACLFAFYYAREQAAPGYLQTVMNNDLHGRFSQISEGHEGDWNFYLKLFSGEMLPIYAWFAPAILGFGLWVGRDWHRWQTSFGVFACVAAFSFLLVISISATKLPWYAMPAYPLLALGASYPLLLCMEAILTQQLYKSPIIAGVVFLCLISFPLQQVWEFCYKPAEHDHYDPFVGARYYAVARWVRDDVAGGNCLPAHSQILCQGPYAHILWYIKLGRHVGKEFELIHEVDELVPGRSILISDTLSLATLQARMRLQAIAYRPGAVLYQTYLPTDSLTGPP